LFTVTGVMVPVMNFETKDAVYTQEKKQREGFVYMEIWRIIFFPCQNRIWKKNLLLVL